MISLGVFQVIRDTTVIREYDGVRFTELSEFRGDPRPDVELLFAFELDNILLCLFVLSRSWFSWVF